jgi:hypothetical protein
MWHRGGPEGPRRRGGVDPAKLDGDAGAADRVQQRLRAAHDVLGVHQGEPCPVHPVRLQL